MEYELKFIVTKDIVRIATHRFWIQFVGWGGLIRWAIVSALLLILCLFVPQTWFLSLVAVGIVCLPLIWVFGYFTFLRRAYQRYDLMQNKQIVYRFSEQGIGTESDLGTAQIPWRMLEKVGRYPDVWLLFFGGNSYAYLPTTEITESIQDYIRQQAEKQGVKPS